MSLRTDLLPVVDAGRALADALGFRQRLVTVRTRTWTSGVVGRGPTTDDDLVLDPVPKVAEPPARLIFAAPGQYEQGDVIVSRISGSYDESAIHPAPSAGVEVYWLIEDRVGDGGVREYVAVAAPKNLSFGYTIQLRRRNRPRA